MTFSNSAVYLVRRLLKILVLCGAMSIECNILLHFLQIL